jgi:hypothetical protein
VDFSLSTIPSADSVASGGRAAIDDKCKAGEKLAHALACRKGPAFKSKARDPRSMITELLPQADRPRSEDEIANEAEWSGWEETIKHR